MDVQFGKVFIKQYDKADIKIRKAFQERLRLFRENPHHPQLRNHLLIGKYQGYQSINITGDWRALYIEKTSSLRETVIEFRLFGTHSQLYKK